MRRVARRSLAAACALAGCERTMKDMYVQPKLGPDAASPLWADGKGSRPPPPGSVPIAAGDLAKTSSGRHGRDELAARDAADAASAPPADRPRAAAARPGALRRLLRAVPQHRRRRRRHGRAARLSAPADASTRRACATRPIATSSTSSRRATA